MIQLHYSDGYVITSEAVGEAVIDFARALAQGHTSEVVTIPIVDESGVAAESTMLIGPASQLYTTPTDVTSPSVEDPALVEELERRARALQSRAVVPDDDVHDFGGLDPHDF